MSAQLDIDFARKERDEGITRAVANADGDVPGWSALGFSWVKLFAVMHRGKQFTGRDIVLASRAQVIQPPNDKAWGGPIQKAVREGVIRKCGFTQDPNRHCAIVPQYTA